MRWGATVALAALATLPAVAGPAQAPPSGADSVAQVRFAAGVAPDTVTVGDPFVSTLRVQAPPGSRVTFVGVPAGDSLQQRAGLRTLPGGAGEARAAYPLVAWIAGIPIRAHAEVRVALPGGAPRAYSVPLALPTVRSVLPTDTAGLRPRAARGVLALPGRKLPWPWILLAAALLVAGAAVLLARRRRPPVPHAGDPRAEALAELDRIAAAAAATPPATVHADVARALRRYLAALDPAWGEPWTTTELLPRMRRAGTADAALREVADLLQRADRVKFAGQPATPAEAEALVADARSWVSAFPPPEPAAAAEAA